MLGSASSCGNFWAKSFIKLYWNCSTSVLGIHWCVVKLCESRKNQTLLRVHHYSRFFFLSCVDTLLSVSVIKACWFCCLLKKSIVWVVLQLHFQLQWGMCVCIYLILSLELMTFQQDFYIPLFILLYSMISAISNFLVFFSHFCHSFECFTQSLQFDESCSAQAKFSFKKTS